MITINWTLWTLTFTAGAILAGLGALIGVAVARHRQQARTARRWLHGRTNQSSHPLRRTPLFALLAATGWLAGQGCGAANTAFVNAEDQTQRAIAPEYLNYVQADPALTPDQKARRQRTVALWRASIDQALSPGAINAPDRPAPSPTTQP